MNNLSKRILDLVISTTLLILLLPIMLLVVLAIAIDNSGPILFRQQRVGLRGQLFGMLKFRSMVVGADAKGPYFTDENDSRITRVGAILRKTSLDELPQLFNVILGDMSLVGPRPDVPAQQANYTAENWTKRVSVLPGITGLAQATKRSLATEQERLQLDLQYADTHNLFFDIRILFMTFTKIISKGGF